MTTQVEKNACPSKFAKLHHLCWLPDSKRNTFFFLWNAHAWCRFGMNLWTHEIVAVWARAQFFTPCETLYHTIFLTVWVRPNNYVRLHMHVFFWKQSNTSISIKHSTSKAVSSAESQWPTRSIGLTARRCAIHDFIQVRMISRDTCKEQQTSNTLSALLKVIKKDTEHEWSWLRLIEARKKH